MTTYLIINLLISLLCILSLVLLRNAPARTRFYVCLVTLVCWLIPWPYLQLGNEIESLSIPFNIVFELHNLVAHIGATNNGVTPDSASPALPLASINIVHSLTNWFWPVSLTFGVLLFCRDMVAYCYLNNQWQRLSTNQNELWQQAGFNSQPYEIRCMDECGPGMATGIIKPVIWLSQKRQKADNLRTILLHELTHIRQHDPLWLWLLNLAKCLLWWNPIVRVLRHYSAQQIELSCDEQCQQLLPRGQYQQQLIELTLWANQQSKKLSTRAEKSMPLILEMSSTKAFNLQRIQHLNKETPMKLRYSIILAALISTTLGIGLSNAKVNNPSPNIQSPKANPISQAFQLMAEQDYQSASAMLASMTSDTN